MKTPKATTNELLKLSLPTFPNIETAKGYLGALVDGEGSISDKPKNRRMRITNTELPIILAAMSALQMLGANFSVVKTKTKKGLDCWNVSVGVAAMQNLKCLTLYHPQKQATLQNMNFQRRKYTPEKIAKAKELREQGLTYKEIGEIMGTTDCAISNWLKRAA